MLSEFRMTSCAGWDAETHGTLSQALEAVRHIFEDMEAFELRNKLRVLSESADHRNCLQTQHLTSLQGIRKRLLTL